MTLMLFVLLLFVGVVANVGQAVNRRIALQIVADTGAYTGASMMATGLNQLAFWNAALQYSWALFAAPGSPVYTPFQAQRAGLSFVPTGHCDAIEGWINGWSVVRGALDVVYEIENVGYEILAFSKARRVSALNARDLFPTEELTYAEFDSAADIGQDPLGSILPARSLEELDESPRVANGTDPKAIPLLKSLPFSHALLIPAQNRLQYACYRNVPPFGIPVPFWPAPRRLVTWHTHADTVSSFAWIVKAPATRALMFDAFFGGHAIPEMKAAAVAKPTGGSLEEGRREYVAKMVPLATVMTGRRLFHALLPDWLDGWVPGGVGWISDDRYDRGRRIVSH